MNSVLIFSDPSVINLMHSSFKRLKYGLSTQISDFITFSASSLPLR